jgi:hypothetical protein
VIGGKAHQPEPGEHEVVHRVRTPWRLVVPALVVLLLISCAANVILWLKLRSSLAPEPIVSPAQPDSGVMTGSGLGPYPESAAAPAAKPTSAPKPTSEAEAKPATESTSTGGPKPTLLPQINSEQMLQCLRRLDASFPQPLRAFNEKLVNATVKNGRDNDLLQQPLAAYVWYNLAQALLSEDLSTNGQLAVAYLDGARSILEHHHCRNSVLYLKTLENLALLCGRTDNAAAHSYLQEIEQRRNLLGLDAEGRSVYKGFSSKRFVEPIEAFLLPPSDSGAVAPMHNDIGLTEEEETAVQATAAPDKHYFDFKSHGPAAQARTLETRLIDTNVLLLDVFTPGSVTAKALEQTVGDALLCERFFLQPKTVFTPYAKLNSERANFVLRSNAAAMAGNLPDSPGRKGIQAILAEVHQKKKSVESLCRGIPSEVLDHQGEGTLFIDIGPGVANQALSAVSSMEIAVDFPKMTVVALDLPEQVALMSKISARAKDKLRQFANVIILAGDGLKSLKIQIEDYNRANDRKINVDAARMLIVRAANSIDIYCPWTSNKESNCRHALEVMARDFRDKPLLLFFNRSILFKPREQTAYQLLGESSSSGFSHHSDELSRGQEEPYTMLYY